MTKAITALRERPRGRVDVELDGARWRTLPTAVVARAGLVVGRPLDRETARQLARELRRARALTRATRSLSASDHSRSALEARLARSGHSPAARQEALAALESAGLVDDARVARNRADAMAARGYGNAAIRADLARRLVPGEVAREAIEELEPEAERARRVVESRGASPTVLRRLAARGFSRDTLEELAARAFAEDT